jgi:hypothetical protein
MTAAFIACGALGVAHADDERNPLESKFTFEAGYFFLSTDMRVRVDGETTEEVGSDVNFDDTFGIGDFDRFRAEGTWRIAPRHLIHAMYFQNNRTATRSLEREVNFQDEVYPVGATVHASSDLTIAQLSYEYAFVRKPTWELAGSAGLHYVDISLGLDATISAQGNQASRQARGDASTQAPLPVLGLRGLWRLGDNFYATAQVQYFYIELDPYSGSLIDLKATIVWQASDHVGVGIGYNDFGFRFDITDKNDFDGRLRWDYGGAMAFATFMF